MRSQPLRVLTRTQRPSSYLYTWPNQRGGRHLGTEGLPSATDTFLLVSHGPSLNIHSSALGRRGERGRLTSGRRSVHPCVAHRRDPAPSLGTDSAVGSLPSDGTRHLSPLRVLVPGCPCLGTRPDPPLGHLTLTLCLHASLLLCASSPGTSGAPSPFPPFREQLLKPRLCRH